MAMSAETKGKLTSGFIAAGTALVVIFLSHAFSHMGKAATTKVAGSLENLMEGKKEEEKE